MKTLEEAKLRVDELERAIAAERAEHDTTKAELRHAKDERKSARRKLRLEVAAKLRRHIDIHQRAQKPGGWSDGAVIALARAHKEIEAIADDGPDDEEG